SSLRLVVCPLAPTSETYPLSLHDALPILRGARLHGTTVGSHWAGRAGHCGRASYPCPHARTSNARRDQHLSKRQAGAAGIVIERDRKSTRLNSSHVKISYAVFCLKKKKKT